MSRASDKQKDAPLDKPESVDSDMSDEEEDEGEEEEDDEDDDDEPALKYERLGTVGHELFHKDSASALTYSNKRLASQYFIEGSLSIILIVTCCTRL